MILPSTDAALLSLPRYSTFILAIFLVCSYAISRRLSRARSFRAFAIANECVEAPKRKQQSWKLGADTIYESWRWKKEHKYLELLQKNFNDYGKTYTSKVLGVNKLTTIEPANIEAILKTASLLSNLWFMLARDERVWTKLKQEVDALQGVVSENEAVKQMPYLRACINESLRCHPAIPWSLRSAARDTVLPAGGGPDGKSPIALTKGTTVLVPLYCLHRREEHWGADADAFRPERWDDISPEPYTYIPFLAGPRMCLGYQFAINTVSYVSIRLIQQLEGIKAADEGLWKEELGLSMTSADGARVSLQFKTV